MMHPNKFRQLAQARLNYETAKAALDERIMDFYEQPEIVELKLSADAAKTELDDCDKQVRGDLLANYEFQRIKKDTGFEIKIMKSVVIPDIPKAVEWCLSHFTPALKLDEKIFKSAVKSGTIPGTTSDGGARCLRIYLSP